MENDKTKLFYYLQRNLKPKEFSLYTDKKPYLLEKFNNKEKIKCRIHGEHNLWYKHIVQKKIY